MMPIILILLMLCVLLILVTGLVVMVKGGTMNKQWGNRLMVMRVGLQAITILLLFLLFAQG